MSIVMSTMVIVLHGYNKHGCINILFIMVNHGQAYVSTSDSKDDGHSIGRPPDDGYYQKNMRYYMPHGTRDSG